MFAGHDSSVDESADERDHLGRMSKDEREVTIAAL
jgi:hypothetical protein